MIPASQTEVDIEQSLLGACLINPEVVDLVAGMVTPQDFAEPIHASLFEAFRVARDEGRRIDVTLVKGMLGKLATQNIAPNLNVGEYLSRLVEATPTVLNAPDYARLIVDNAGYRRIVAVADELRGRALLGIPGGSPTQIASDAISGLDALATVRGKATRVSAGAAAKAAAEASEDRAKHGVEEGVTWGLWDLDKVTKLYPGELTIVAARPSMGKTTLGLSVARAAAQSGEGVLFFSLEMGSISLGQRLLSDICFDGYNPGISYADIRDGKLIDGAPERITDAILKAAALPIVIEEQSGLTISQIIARVRTGQRYLHREFGRSVGLIVIDHLGLIAAADRYAGARHLELGAMTAALKGLAKEMGVPVLLLCQLSRGVEGRDNKRPMLSDLRESGRIEEDADAVLLLYREAYYLERAREKDPDKEIARVERLAVCQSILEVHVAKQRQGATKTIEAFVSMPHNAVRNMHRSVM